MDSDTHEIFDKSGNQTNILINLVMDLFSLALSIPKTIYFNFRYLPLSQAIKLPIWVRYNTKIRMGG